MYQTSLSILVSSRRGTLALISMASTLTDKLLPYLREKEPMGGGPYIGSRLGGGPIFAVSLSQLHAKERPGKLPMRSSLFE